MAPHRLTSFYLALTAILFKKGGGRSSYFIKGHNGEHCCEVILLLDRLVEQEKMLFKVIVFNVLVATNQQRGT